jgi:hypothetical protein
MLKSFRGFDKQKLMKLNTMTKYPSILTYHAMGERGRLSNKLTTSFEGEQVTATEKVDGTNSRIIFNGEESFIIGSREELLHCSGDIIYNPDNRIVESYLPFIEELDKLRTQFTPSKYRVTVLYFESYGGKINGGKNYTNDPTLTNIRLFDVVVMTEKEVEELLEKDLSIIASWREHGGLRFLPYSEIACDRLVPIIPLEEVPADHAGVLEMLKAKLPKTLCGITLDNKGKAEGLVIRTDDKTKIAKIRFEDYERTLDLRGK